MLVINIALLVTGVVVLLVHQTNAQCSCTCNAGAAAAAASAAGWLSEGACGLGLGVDMCGGDASLDWGPGGSLSGGIAGVAGIEGLTGFGVNSDAPIVVRPQEIPKPALDLTAALAPIAGPCVCKKAIVKPAVLPKPVCRPTQMVGGAFGAGGLFGGTMTTTTNVINQYDANLYGAMGVGAFDAAGNPILVDGGAIYTTNQADLVPADAVSLSIAYQNAQNAFAFPAVEDRLAFGFRKIPEEIPQQIIIKPTIPEEQIFSLNGQIVELKPMATAVCSCKTLEEEAHEELLALQEEEANAENICAYGGVRTLTLGDLGYGPANIPRKTFIDIPPLPEKPGSGGDGAGALGDALGSLASALGLGGGAAKGALGSLGKHALKAGLKDGFIAGDVVYKTIPKIDVFAPVEVPPDYDDCESNEMEEIADIYSEPDLKQSLMSSGVTCGMCCSPCCSAHNVYHTSSSSSSAACAKKASVLVQRLIS